MKKAKVLAFLTAASLGVSSVGSAAYAASFTEYLQSQYETGMEAFEEGFQEGLAAGEAAAEKTQDAKFDIHVSLGEMGKAMLSMMAPVDLSWMNSANLGIETHVDEKEVIGKMLLSLNEADLLTLNYQWNLETMLFLLQAPEISEAILGGDYMTIINQAAETSGEAASAPISQEQMQEITQITQNLTLNPPSEEVLKALANRYYGIVMSAYEDGAVEPQVLDVQGISVETTMLEGVVTQEKALAMVNTLVETLQADEEIKALIEQAVQGTSYEGVLYEQLQGALAEAQTELSTTEVDPEDDSVVALRFWVDGEGALVGEQVAMVSADFEQPIATWMAAKTEDTWGFEAWAEVDGLMTLNGTGTLADGRTQGELIFSVDETPYVSIALDQTANEEEMAAGHFDGSYTVTPIIPEAAEGEEASYSPMSSFEGMALTADVVVDGPSGALSLTALMSGSPLATVTFSADAAYAGGDYADLAAAGTYCDITDEEQLNAFAESLDPEALLAVVTEKLTAAGMPEGFIESLMAETGMAGEESYDESDAAEDYRLTEESAEAETAEAEEANTAGGAVGAIGGAVAPVVEEAEETTEEAAPGLVDWNNKQG